MTIAALSCLVLLGFSKAAQAHHAMGGNLPSNFLEGFLSGLAHPVIGLDHLAFVVAIGILSAGRVRASLIPITFVLTAMFGTGIHLLSVDLPVVEPIIALSILVIGAILAFNSEIRFLVLLLLAGVAGLFHGYAYGESIIGSEMTPLFAYLTGFTLIQYGIALLSMKLSSILAQRDSKSLPQIKRWWGYGIAIAGLYFLTIALTS
ncbi:HupE/UreJ family protein [Leptolyngbya sp. NK1-12]|uniref:HupE/UreJ family protein n=1 Tax=Leptolyngbya sp. NK1-12 TaxID=2547451 RepID=UPI002931938E|nr:HupE/UreJ family protein [Leptolyngbya sp. NK1-12]